MTIKIKLEDFDNGGAVPSIKWGKAIRDDHAAATQIKKWIKAGWLVCPGEADPHHLDDLLVHAAETPNVPAASPAAASPADAVEPVQHSWTYRLGQEARQEDDKLLSDWTSRGDLAGDKPERSTHNLVGMSAARWEAGYQGLPEPTELPSDAGETSATSSSSAAAIGDGTSSELASVPAASSDSASQPGIDGADEAREQSNGIDGISGSHGTHRNSEATGGDGETHACERCGCYGSDHQYHESPWDNGGDGRILCPACIASITAAAEKAVEQSKRKNLFDPSTFEGNDDMATATKPKNPKGSTTKGNTKAKAKGKPDESTTDDVVAGASDTYRIEDEIVKRPLSWFTQSPYDKRSSRPAEWVKELAASLRQDGQLAPCLARPDGQHIAGWTRVLAARDAGLSELQVRIVHCDDLTARRLVLIDNAKRKELTEREQCEAYNELAVEYTRLKKSDKQLAADLGMARTTLAGKLRLKSLQPEIWDRYEADLLSIDQIRQIATHAMVPGFSDAVIKYLESLMTEGRPGEVSFNNALSMGFNAAYRPMEKGQFAFKPNATQKIELGIETVDHPRLGKIEVSSNPALWEQLEAEAKKKKADKAASEKESQTEESASAPPAKPLKAAKKAQDDNRLIQRRTFVGTCWMAAHASAIKAKFAAPKKGDIPVLTRLTILVQQLMRESEQMQLETIFSDDATFLDEIRAGVSTFFDTERTASQFEANWLDLSLQDLQLITERLSVPALPHWHPTAELLKTLDDKELVALRDELDIGEGVLDSDRAELERRCLDAWQPGGTGVGWCPAVFELPKAE